MKFRLTAVVAAIATAFLLSNCTFAQGIKYPQTPVRTVVDTLHGTLVSDDYRWLENGADPEVIEWTREQNELTRSILDSCSGREKLAAKIEDAIRYEDVGTPKTAGGRLFFTRQSESQDQPVLYMRQGLDGKDIELVNPNQLSARGIVSLDWYFPSRDGSLLAYGLSSKGDEQSTLFVIDTEKHEHLEDTIPRTSAVSLAWLPDNSGFYYTRYPLPGEVPAEEEVYHRTVYVHKLGDDFQGDQKIYESADNIQDWPSVLLSESGRYLVVYVFKGWSNSDLYLDDLTDQAGFQTLVKNRGAYFDGEFLGEDLYVRTNLEAPNYRILRASFDGADVSEWPDIVPENDSMTMPAFKVAAASIAVEYLYQVSSRLYLCNPETHQIKEVDLPGTGSLGEIRGDPTGDLMFFSYQSFLQPKTIYRLKPESGQIERHDGVKIDFDPSNFTTEFVWYESKDGTPVSMYIVHRRDLTLDGGNPTILTGYGGFNHTETPYFSNTRVIWLKAGGVFALPHLRGGGEYGEEWHKAGMLANKQNTFDDFIAAAEYLIHEGYTNPNKLAIWGGSNGGLLVGAAMTQRPDLFKAVICGNPLLDMIRYHKFLIARLWIPEYGSADNPDDFQYIYAYSPYQHVMDGTRYPSCLILTSDSDTRVDPLHARKMVARLQAANSADTPQLLKFEFDAGHGAGKPTWKVVESYTDDYIFIANQLGVDLGTD
jgi:prolyl oligopeptidase